MIRAATSDSSSARLAGCLPCAWESTTVTRGRLMMISYAFLHVALEHSLRLFPVCVQEGVIIGDIYQYAGVAVKFE